MEDTLAKVGMKGLLSPFVEVDTQHEVRLPSQFVDVLVASHAADPEALWRSLGWLGRMVATVCLLEAFSTLVDEADALACVRKQLAVHHERELAENRGRAAGQPVVRVPVPLLWLLVWTTPQALLAGWNMRPAEGWPDGFFEGGLGALRVFVVVLDQLAVEPEMIPRKLFGDAFTRWYALRQLRELPAENAIVQAVRPLLFWWDIYLKGQPEDEETRRFRMELAQFVEQEQKRLKDEGRVEGRVEGKAEGRAEGKAEGKAEGRAEAVLAVLAARGLVVPEDVRQRVLASRDGARLDAWLKAAAVADSIEGFQAGLLG